MSTVQQVMQHGRAFLKVGANYASNEEVRMANTINSIIGMYYRWHWMSASGGDISVSLGTQDYSLTAGDQNTVLAIQNGYLTDASNTYPPLTVEGNIALPVTNDSGRPYAVGLLSPTLMRFFPNPDATYVFHWRKHKRPTVFTANTESYDCPSSFDAVVKAGILWQLLDYQDDVRSTNWQKTFYDSLGEQKAIERVTMGRTR
jgi:hypothetical protein